MDDNARTGELRRKLDKDPGSRLFGQLAEELRKDGKLEESISVARKGLEKNPNYPSARLTLARALLDSGRPREARPELEQIVKASPDNIMASRLLGDALEQLGESAAALAQLEKTLRLSPGDKAVTEKIAEMKAKAAPASAPAPAPAAPPAAPSGALPSVFAEEPPAVTLVPSALPPAPVALDRDLASGTFSPGALNAVDIQKHFDEAAAAAAVGTPASVDVEETVGFGELKAAVVLPATLPPVVLPPTVPPAAPPYVAPEVSSASAAAEAPSVELPSDDAGASTLPLTSMTLADLYLQQGLKAEASAVLSQVIKEEPENAQARSKFAAVSSELLQVSPGPAAAAAPAPAMPPPALAPQALPPQPKVERAPPAPPSLLTKAEIRERAVLSLRAFANAAEREAMAQKATERGVI